jgi:hypothetical protein
MAKGKFTSTGFAQVINLPFVPDYVEFVNYTNANAGAAASQVLSAKWDANMGQGFAVVEAYTAASALVYDTVTTNGISTFTAGQALQYGARQQVVSLTKADPAVVEVTGHGYQTGDVVVFTGLYQSATTGMPQIDGIPFTVTRINANTFSIPWNTNQSNYTALAGSPSGAFVKKVLYPYLYFPGVSVISAITTGTTTTIDTTTAHNLVVGQEVAFRIPADYSTVELNSLPNSTTPGSPVYGYVVSVTDYNTVVVSINSTNYTAFTNNVEVSDLSGTSFPQMIAVGDVNTGGRQTGTNLPLYPSPYTFPSGSTSASYVSTINGPAVLGAFVNNTSQGFVIGAGVGTTVTSGVLVGDANDVIYWRAYLHDMSIP